MTHDGFYTAGSTRRVLHVGFYTLGSQGEIFPACRKTHINSSQKS